MRTSIKLWSTNNIRHVTKLLMPKLNNYLTVFALYVTTRLSPSHSPPTNVGLAQSHISMWHLVNTAITTSSITIDEYYCRSSSFLQPCNSEKLVHWRPPLCVTHTARAGVSFHDRIRHSLGNTVAAELFGNFDPQLEFWHLLKLKSLDKLSHLLLGIYLKILNHIQDSCIQRSTNKALLASDHKHL